MTVFYSTELAGITSQPVVKATSQAYGARLIRFRASITLATQTTADTIVVAVVPAGYDFAFGVLTTDTSLATSTIAIGIAGTVALYKAAAVFTATDTPTFFGKAAQVVAPAITADQTIFITIAVASLPAAGNLAVEMYFSRQ